MSDTITPEQQKEIERIQNADPLFGDKHLMGIADKLSDEDKARYAVIGKELYDSISFGDINSVGTQTNHEVVELENVSQLRLMLSSGMHPSFLTGEEKNIMKNNFGEKWYEEYGFLECDLQRVNL